VLESRVRVENVEDEPVAVAPVREVAARG
jgi:hypothetical protein